MELLDWIQCLVILIFHINVHQRASTMEELLNNQIDRITQPVEVILLCSSAMPVLAQWAHEKSAVLAGMEECICIASNISMLI